MDGASCFIFDKFYINCPIEQKMNLRIENWYISKLKEFEKERKCYRQNNQAIAGSCLIRHCKMFLKAEILYIEKDFDYEELKHKHFWEIVNNNEYMEKSELFPEWLKEHNYISYFEKIDFNKELIPSN